ncbi:MAG TPA: hypothetical protein VHR55_00020 [Candidatus Limnocylindria bacterium]|nr:hypothetical protein [Candidatus Limnocylindria bacterium]
MPETAVGYAILGVGLLVVLGIVFILASRANPTGERPKPPRGVHLPAPSFLPVVFAVGAALLGAAVVFRSETEVANPVLAIAGILVIVAGIIGWVRAADHEWREVEHGAHDDGHAAH